MYHVLNRSVGKRHLFGKDADFEACQRVMIEAHQRHPIRILSYCVLSNHWHFAVWPDADGQVTAFFRWLPHHACDALEGRAPDRRVRSSVSGTVQELPGAERRTSGAACGRGCMEKMRSRPSHRLGQWNAPWIGPIA